jgi:hypothetical protein
VSRYVWNRLTRCRVPFTGGLDVAGHPDLEWRDEEAPEEGAAETQDGEETEESLVGLIGELNKDDEAHWTKGGLPDARVLSEKANRQVTKVERDEAWAEYQKGQV